MALTDQRTLSTHDPFSRSRLNAGPQINNPIQFNVPILMVKVCWFFKLNLSREKFTVPGKAVKRRLKQERVDVGVYRA